MGKKYKIDIAFGSVILVLIGFIVYITLRKPDTFQTVMEIDNQKVVKEEYQMVLSGYQAQVKSQYTTDEANSPDFWTTSFHGETPLEKIMELAKQELTRKKMIAVMAEEEGIQADVEYETLKESGEAENQSRKQKENSGEVVYGLTSYSTEAYYQYVYDNLEKKLEETLKKKYEVSDEDLQNAYRENQDAYTYETGVRILAAEMSQSSAKKELVEDITEALQEGKTEEELKAAFLDVTFYEMELNSLKTEEGKSGVYSGRWIAASAMREGEVSSPVEAGGNCIIMKCLERTENGVRAYDDVKDVLKSQIQTEKADTALEDRIEAANIRYKEEKLKKLALETLQSS